MSAPKPRTLKSASATASTVAAPPAPLSAERLQFLEARLAASPQAPQLRALQERLLAIGGVALVPPQEPSNCHENVKRLWMQNPELMMATGYALSENGLWRSHSWAMDHDRIIETTELRTAYYGFVVPTDE